MVSCGALGLLLGDSYVVILGQKVKWTQYQNQSKKYFMWQTIVYQPILNALVGVYGFIGIQDFGVAIIVLSVIIRLFLWPIVRKEVSSRQAMMALQPKLNDLKNQHKDDRQKQAQAMMDLYKQNKVNPFASCLPILIQLPFFLGLYQVIRHVTVGDLSGLYTFVEKPDTINFMFLGLVDLASSNIVLAVLAGLAQWWQGRFLQSQQPSTGDANAQMLAVQMQYILPVVTVFIAWRLPSALALLWILNSLLAYLQQILIMKLHPVPVKEIQ